MRSRVRLGVAVIISLMPLNGLRVLGYRGLGYRVEDSRIGLGTVIAVESAWIRSARIGPLNLFLGPIRVEIQPGATIGNRNEFSSGSWVAEAQFRGAGYKRTLAIGEGATITCRHFFDIAGAFTLGERSWVAGLGSQFWTHGAGAPDRDIAIGTDCYIGSVVRFAPGASIGNNVLVAMGSVVTSPMRVDNALVGGVPAKALKTDYDWRSRSAIADAARPS